METRQITLKCSIITPRHKTIAAGTILYFDEDGSTTFEDETLFLYRIHALCYDVTVINNDNYFPDYFVDSRDEMLGDDGDELYDGLGVLSVSDVAFGPNCIELAQDFNSYLKWDWLSINQNTIGITADDGRDLYFILSKPEDLTFRLQTYAFSLLEEEITEKNIGDCVELKIDGTDTIAKVFAFGRGREWIDQQVSKRSVGRNGEPIKLNLASDTEALHVLCEYGRGQLMILPYGKDYGVEVFGYGIFKNQWYDEHRSDVIYPRSLMRFSISYVESLELFAKISTSDIDNCKIAVIERGEGNNEYLEAFNDSCIDIYPILTYTTVEQCIAIEKYFEYIKGVLNLNDLQTGNTSTISFVPVKDAYYNCMRVNPVIRIRTGNSVNRSLGFNTEHTIVCIGEYAYGLLPRKDGFVMGEPGFEMEIDNIAKISEIDFSDMEFTQFKYDTFCFDDEKFNASILDDFDTFSASQISEADFLKIKPCKIFL